MVSAKSKFFFTDEERTSDTDLRHYNTSADSQEELKIGNLNFRKSPTFFCEDLFSRKVHYKF